MSNDIDEVIYVHPETGTQVPVPSSHSTILMRCGDRDCGHVHIFLLDKMKQPIAEATLTQDFCNAIVDFWKKHRRQ